MKLAGWWVYLSRAIDQYGQVIDVVVSEKRDLVATRRSHSCPRTRPTPDRSDHRSGSRVSASNRGADTCRVPRHRAVCKQSRRSRSWASESPATADARAETAALGTGDQYRAHVRAEPCRGHCELGWDIDRRHRLQRAGRSQDSEDHRGGQVSVHVTHWRRNILVARVRVAPARPVVIPTGGCPCRLTEYGELFRIFLGRSRKPVRRRCGERSSVPIAPARGLLRRPR